MRLTEEEREILASVERGEWKSMSKLEKEKQRYQTAARAAERKDKRVNIRMTQSDFVRFQKRAEEEGLPYQTLISSILHKYITGRSNAPDSH